MESVVFTATLHLVLPYQTTVNVAIMRDRSLLIYTLASFNCFTKTKQNKTKTKQNKTKQTKHKKVTPTVYQKLSRLGTLKD